MDGTWTISELAERAAAALAADASAQVSGRVRDVPNERLIRWYTTIGLVDPPLGRRGRAALYGPRHLLQLIAVKRRQAAGRSIAEIQVELTAATDAALERIAARPSPRTGPPNATAPGTTERNGRPAALTEIRAEVTDRGDPPADDTGRTNKTGPNKTGSTEDSGRTDGAAPADRTDPADGKGGPARSPFWRARPDVSHTDISHTDAVAAGGYGESDTSAKPRNPVVQGVRLTPGVTLLLDVPTLDGPALDGEDLAAIETAARPLLDELRRRGLPAPAASPAYLPADPSRRFQ